MARKWILISIGTIISHSNTCVHTFGMVQISKSIQLVSRLYKKKIWEVEEEEDGIYAYIRAKNCWIFSTVSDIFVLHFHVLEMY